MRVGSDVLERRNRGRIVALVLLATVNYSIAAAAAAVATGLGVLFAILANAGDIPTDGDSLKIVGVAIVAIAALSAVIGFVLAIFRIPFLRRRLEARVLAETGARVASPDEHPRVRNLLEALAIAADIPVPRFAVVDQPAPNSFSIGTRPGSTLLAITTGLEAALTRDELEAVLAYEVSRIRSWDVALGSWTVALTGSAMAAVEADEDHVLRGVLGWIPRRLAQRLQVWALRDQCRERDRAAVTFTRHPHALIRALEKLQADTSEIRGISVATAPLWVEFPARVLRVSRARTSRALEEELLLEHRIADLKQLVGEPAL
jgi:heat shock protein HtpX